MVGDIDGGDEPDPDPSSTPVEPPPPPLEPAGLGAIGLYLAMISAVLAVGVYGLRVWSMLLVVVVNDRRWVGGCVSECCVVLY